MKEDAEVEAICTVWYGEKWNATDPKHRPPEKMKSMWRNFAKQAISTIDEIRAKQ